MSSSFLSPLRHLRFADVLPGGAFHAALVTTEADGKGLLVGAHTHDFYEIMLIVGGEIQHAVQSGSGADTDGARTALMRSGDVVFIRPSDCHQIRIERGKAGAYFNVAFSRAVWQEWSAFVGGGDRGFDTFSHPPAHRVAEADRELCAAYFRAALADFQRPDSGRSGTVQRLNLARFLSATLPVCFPDCLAAAGENDGAWENAPSWLVRACRTLRENDAFLRDGLPRFVQLSGVSASHLARVCKAVTGQTPTEYVNGLRLARAAVLLTTTTQPVVPIALDCGFDQLSYFYRLFHVRFGTSPQKYRARRTTAPVGTE